MTSVTDPQNHTSSISYNASGNVSGLTDATNATTSFAYKTSSDTACTNVPNSTFPCTVVTVTPVTTAEKTTYAYNGLRVRYVLDANGHEEQRQYTPDANVSTYTDALNNSNTFTFDVGTTNNLLSVTDGNGAVTSFGYSNTTNPYLVTTQQDTQGNTMSYGYDPAGNLTSTQDTTTNGTGTSASYAYNAKNQTTGIGIDSYTYSGPDQTERVQLNSDTFAYSGLGLSIRNGADGTTYYNRCSCGQLVDERLANGNKHYYIFDSLGSVVGLTDPSGSQLVDTYSYDPTGNILSQTGTVPNNWQYAGATSTRTRA